MTSEQIEIEILSKEFEALGLPLPEKTPRRVFDKPGPAFPWSQASTKQILEFAKVVEDCPGKENLVFSFSSEGIYSEYHGWGVPDDVLWAKMLKHSLEIERSRIHREQYKQWLEEKENYFAWVQEKKEKLAREEPVENEETDSHERSWGECYDTF